MKNETYAAPTALLMVVRRKKEWSPPQLAGCALVLALAIILVVTLRLLRQDGIANRERQYERRYAQDAALAEYVSDCQAQRRREEAPDKPAPRQRRERAKQDAPAEDLASLPDQMSAADFQALPPELRAKLLASARPDPKKSGSQR